jgi:hypothetical protein
MINIKAEIKKGSAEHLKQTGKYENPCQVKNLNLISYFSYNQHILNLNLGTYEDIS